MTRKTTEEYVNQAKLIHGDKYDYSLVNYKGALKKIKINCKLHGFFDQEASSHLAGTGCKQCALIKNTSCVKTFIEKANTIHGFKYNYDRVVYVNSKRKIIITCHLHGDFLQTPSKHLSNQGCSKCSIIKVVQKNSSNTKEFVEKAKEIHKDNYNYVKTLYVKATEKVIINCKKHGNFYQTPNAHLTGRGCEKCKNDLTSIRNKNNPTGWSLTNWQKAGEKSKNFDSFKVYIIKCWNDKETFYKIGKTFTSLQKRFKYKNLLPYNWNIVKVYEGNAKDISDLEVASKHKNKEFKYIPKTKFNGMYECFSKIKL